MIAFTADCEPCEWQGSPRADNLAALADFDRHAAGHRPTPPPVELCADCGHGSDGHDRRSDDFTCEECGPFEACGRRIA